MTYLILDAEGNMVDMIVFESDTDVQAYKLANPDMILESTDDLDELFLDDELEGEDEW